MVTHLNLLPVVRLEIRAAGIPISPLAPRLMVWGINFRGSFRPMPTRGSILGLFEASGKRQILLPRAAGSTDVARARLTSRSQGPGLLHGIPAPGQLRAGERPLLQSQQSWLSRPLRQTALRAKCAGPMQLHSYSGALQAAGPCKTSRPARQRPLGPCPRARGQPECFRLVTGCPPRDSIGRKR